MHDHENQRSTEGQPDHGGHQHHTGGNEQSSSEHGHMSFEHNQDRNMEQPEASIPQPVAHVHKSHKHPARTYVVAIVALLVAIFIANIVREEVPDMREDVTVADPVNGIVVTINDGTNSGIKINLTNFDEYILLDEFENLDQASSIINSAQGKPTSGEGSESIVFGVVDSSEDNMVYFATKDYNSQTGEMFVGIYHYNTETSRWQRVYKTTYEAQEESSTPFMRVIARSDSRLILLKDRQDNSPGPCTNVWLMGESEPFELLAMNLEDPYAGLEVFPLPDALRQTAQAQVEACQTSL